MNIKEEEDVTLTSWADEPITVAAVVAAMAAVGGSA